ncbi:MAG: hypothetical protein OEY93_10650 [Anaerolineae bacterium]|nr:hypothetical protein [Anaerolineae bacterium]
MFNYSTLRIWLYARILLKKQFNGQKRAIITLLLEIEIFGIGNQERFYQSGDWGVQYLKNGCHTHIFQAGIRCDGLFGRIMQVLR